MDKAKQKRLKARGWKFGDAAEFLALSPAEQALVELKLSLSRSLRELRLRKGMSQVALARLIGSSQSRVAKMESGSSNVTLDLTIKAMIALGASREELAQAMYPKGRAA